ncbi:glycosyltransferase family 2 protein [Candidatus Woesebacteria bacterium]|nr:glycosyltransferase family 2 protein [Candidatus Woesebacteria bacterium]
MKTAVVIIPTYNERDNIAETIGAVFAATKKVANWSVHILVVDDTSPDKTAEVVQKLQKTEKKLHLLVNPNKVGLGGAYLKGMAMAFSKLKADVVFEFDADLSHPPEKLPAFLALIDEGRDMVLGTRYSDGGGIPADWGLHRKFMSIVGNLIIMMVFTNASIRDWTSGYRAITKKVYDAVHPLLHSERFSGYTFQIGFLYNAVRKGFSIDFVPYQFRDRVKGKSKIGPEYMKNTLIYILKVRLQEIISNRIFKFVVVGGIGALIQFVTLAIFRQLMAYTLAYFLSAEVAVGSNFVLSNMWTFNDRSLTLPEIPKKFLTFNLASFGSVGIQTVLATVGKIVIGDTVPLFAIPFSALVLGKAFIFDTGFLFLVIGILVGMVWNFTAYTKIVWKQK